MVADLGPVTRLTTLNHLIVLYMLWSFFAIFLESQWQGIGEIIDSRSFKRNFLTLWSQHIIFIFLLRTLNTITVKATEHPVKQLLLHVNSYSENHSSQNQSESQENTGLLSQQAWWRLCSRRHASVMMPPGDSEAERLSSGPGERAARSPSSVLGAWVYVFPNGCRSQEKTIQWINRHLGNVNNQIFMNYYYKELKQEGR